MSRIVLKFGGSSVADPERLRLVANRIRKYVEKGHSVAVVVSAMGDTTDKLLNLANVLAGAVHNGREMDQLLATGEQQSISLLSLALEAIGLKTRSFTGRQAGFLVEGFHLEGRIREIHPEMVESSLERGEIPVVAGFQGVTAEGDIITLGRGGSDLSAIALAASIGADSCHIFTDVDGIYTADPRLVPTAVKLKDISYQECMEMAARGAAVLQARGVEMAARAEMDVYVASSFGEKEGTWVMNREINEGLVIKSITSDWDVAKVAVLGVPDVPGIAARLFSGLAERGIGAEMIIQSVMRGQVNDIAFLVKKSLLGEAIGICRKVAGEIGAQGVTFDTEIARISVVGAGIANHPEIPSQMFESLADAGINLDMIASTSMAITCVVSAGHADEAVRVLHGRFIEGTE